MNEKLPKPMLEALAQGAPMEEHPSADLLTAFVEQALEDAEASRVALHLADCRACRDVVFLASNAADGTEELTRETELEQTVAVLPQRLVRAAATPMASAGIAGGGRMRWWPRLVMAGAAAAVLLAVGGYLFVREHESNGSAPIQIASKPAEEAKPTERSAVSAPAIVATVPPSATKPHPSTAVASAPVPSRELKNPAAAIEAEARQPVASAAPVQQSTTEIADAGQTGTSAVPHTGFVAQPGMPNQIQLVPPNAAGSGFQLRQSLHPGWRITPDGHLEHRTTEGWTRVLTEQPQTVRVVALVGGDVWAGGNGGMLFRSEDGGQSWKKVTLPGQAGAILTIHFEDPQNGMISAEPMATYRTTDGGATWVKQ